MEKLKLKRVRKKISKGSTHVRIRKDAYELVEDVKFETGLSTTEVVSRLVEFACKNVEYID